VCSTACHYLQPEQQQRAAQELVYKLPSDISTAEISYALHSADQQQHLKVLQQLTPWHEHLLMPAAAAAGNYTLLQQLLAHYSPAAAAATNSTAGSSSHACAGSSASTSSRDRCACMSADSSSTLQEDTLLLQQLLAPYSPAAAAAISSIAGSSSAGHAGMGADSSSTLQDGARRLQHWLWEPRNPAPAGEGGQDAPQARCGKFLQPLPDLPGLKSFEHNVLLTSLTAAAKGGSAECLQLLLGELASCRAGPAVCAEALTTLAEAAAAAGSLECFQLVRQVLTQTEEQAGEEVDLAPGNLLALRMHTDARRRGHDNQPDGGLLPMLQPQQPLAGTTALQWVQASNFLLVAAAQSGCCRVLTQVMEFLEVRSLV
jgi:hypothetical protein